MPEWFWWVVGLDAVILLSPWLFSFFCNCVFGDDGGHGRPSAMSPRASENYRTRD